jgi:hypothetical protein
MKSKQLKIAVIVTMAFYLSVICLYCFHQGTKSHLNARQAELYTHQLIGNKYDSVRNEILISERTAIKIANQLFSEKYGNLHTFLCKPFDIYSFNSYWFVYGPVSKSKLDGGPMIIINYHTGETRFKL